MKLSKTYLVFTLITIICKDFIFKNFSNNLFGKIVLLALIAYSFLENKMIAMALIVLYFLLSFNIIENMEKKKKCDKNCDDKNMNEEGKKKNDSKKKKKNDVKPVEEDFKVKNCKNKQFFLDGKKVEKENVKSFLEEKFSNYHFEGLCDNPCDDDCIVTLKKTDAKERLSVENKIKQVNSKEAFSLMF